MHVEERGSLGALPHVPVMNEKHISKPFGIEDVMISVVKCEKGVRGREREGVDQMISIKPNNLSHISCKHVTLYVC